MSLTVGFSIVKHLIMARYTSRKNNVPKVLVICWIVETFQSQFILHHKKPSQQRRNARNLDNIASLRASVAENTNLSVNRRSFRLKRYLKMTTPIRCLTSKRWQFNTTQLSFMSRVLENQHEHCFRGIDAKLFHKVTEIWVHQIRSCICSCGKHLNDVLFKP